MEGSYAAHPFYKAEKPEISTGHRITPIRGANGIAPPR